MADFTEFAQLQFVLRNARWAGAPSQEQIRKEYFRERLWSGIRRLPHSEDVLAEVLAEIAAETEGSSVAMSACKASERHKQSRPSRKMVRRDAPSALGEETPQ